MSTAATASSTCAGFEAVDRADVEVVGAEARKRAVDLAAYGFLGKAALVEEHPALQHHLVAGDAGIPERAAMLKREGADPKRPNGFF